MRSHLPLCALILAAGHAAGCDQKVNELEEMELEVEVISNASSQPTEGANRGPAAPVADLSASSCRRHTPGTGLPPVGSPRTGSTVGLATFGYKTVAYVADSDAHELRTIDLDRGEEIASTPLGGEPAQLLVGKDGRVFVTLTDANKVAVYEPGRAASEPLSALCNAPTPAEPTGVAASGSGDFIMVASRWAKRVTTFDANDRLVQHEQFEVARDPFAVALNEDGSKAYVSHLVGGKITSVDLTDPKARALDFARGNITSFQNGGRLVQRKGHQVYAFVQTDDGMLAPTVLVDPGEGGGEIPSTGYGSSSAEAPVMAGLVAKIDTHNDAVVMTSGFRAPGSDCLLPRAAAFDANNQHVLVACQGQDALIAYTRNSPHSVDSEAYRIPVGSGPTGVALDLANGRAVVWSQFDSSVTVAKLDRSDVSGDITVPVATRGGLDPMVALGRELFHSAGQGAIAEDGRACASCHPGGRDDTLSWLTAEGPRQTPVLMGKLTDETTGAALGWNGKNHDLDGHVRRTLRRLGGSGLTARERDALVAYIGSMGTPAATTAELTDKPSLVDKGQALFVSAETGCANCHVEAIGSDGLAHNVGTGSSKGEMFQDFDTPSLRHLAQSAPYFHDGRYTTLKAMLSDQHMKMGKVSHLSSDDVDALAAYLQTL